ncbi:biopolymer transporter ExbD, partial [Pseudomonas syringae group genomosp. 7]|uniref:biopolymer transporter ExbD n=1 Tax=Pseudomonas syringae group genomosp. 7 TaxID=251699 RepID=UPI0037705941
MAFSTQDTDEVHSEINVTPLVDVMLVLLVVFIVTAQLLTNSIQIKLPKTESVAPVAQKDRWVVIIAGQGKMVRKQDQLPTE